MEIFDRLCSIIREYLVVPEGTELSEDTSLLSLGADSLDMAEIVMSIEDTFGITVEEGAEADIHTIGDAVALIEKLTEER